LNGRNATRQGDFHLEMTDAALLMRVREALRAVRAPTGRDIVSLGAVQRLSATSGGVVRFTLDAERVGGGAQEVLDAARAAAAAVVGVARVAAYASQPPPVAPGHDNPLGLTKETRATAAAPSLTDVKNVIVIASGKGGVGKSTVAANLAVAIARRGLATGFLDADIYGPSAPVLFGLSGRPDLRGGKILPIEKFGVKIMSMGLLVDEDRALAWRGPMVMGAVRQLMGDVEWGALDALVIDTPPGTGDAHLTLAQSRRLTGAVIVSTPQELALADVRRGVELFRKLSVPIIGIIENMAWLDSQGTRSYLFGQGGAERAARELGAPFLGALPILPELRIASDEGIPLAAREGPGAAAFAAIADAIAAGFSR
jgi:ATP-binding protein involved in chromosome partitioning